MVDRVLIDTLNFKAKSLASRWKELIRKSPQLLLHYNKLTDEELIDMNAVLYSKLSQTLDRGLDRSIIGDFYVNVGKNSSQRGFPISEMVYAGNLNQQMVVDYLVSEFVLDNPIALYKTLGVLNKVNEFFFLGNFYMIKGFLEHTFMSLNKKHKVPDNILKTHFTDDFFFR